MECLQDFLDRKVAMEPGWGGVGDIKALTHDGGEPGPGEEEQERRTDEWFVRRLIMMEETTLRRGGGSGQGRGGRGGWEWGEAKGW